MQSPAPIIFVHICADVSLGRRNYSVDFMEMSLGNVLNIEKITRLVVTRTLSEPVPRHRDHLKATLLLLIRSTKRNLHLLRCIFPHIQSFQCLHQNTLRATHVALECILEAKYHHWLEGILELPQQMYKCMIRRSLSFWMNLHLFRSATEQGILRDALMPFQ